MTDPASSGVASPVPETRLPPLRAQTTRGHGLGPDARGMARSRRCRLPEPKRHASRRFSLDRRLIPQGSPDRWAGLKRSGWKGLDPGTGPPGPALTTR